MCPLQNLAGVDVDDPVAPSPAAAIGDATVSSVGHRPSSIVAPKICDQRHFAKSKTPAPAGVAAPHRRLAAGRAARSPVIAAALPRARA